MEQQQSPLRTHQPAQGPSSWGHRQFFNVVHLLLCSSSILSQRTHFPQSAQVFLLPPDDLFWHSQPCLLPFRVWWPLSKEPPPLLCQSFHALYTHQPFLKCLKCHWACLVSRCLGLLMCVREKKVQQEIPVLAGSELLLAELSEEMPHQAPLPLLVGILCGFFKQETFQKHMETAPKTSMHARSM